VQALSDDSYQEGVGVQRMGEAMVRLATFMACVLQKDHCTLHCKMSRSRSPSVLAAFFAVFRGQASSLDNLLAYLEESQRAQRPVLSRHSAIFPNFDK
jgi:hypothetical protein